MRKLTIIMIVLIMITGCTNRQEIVIEWYNKYRVVAHAMGGIDDKDYTNSLEAFLLNYKNGTRLFEVDILRTLDNDFALVHDWDQYHVELTNNKNSDYGPVSAEIFKSTLIYNEYTPLLLNDLLVLMNEYRDFYVIVDSKTFSAEETRIFYHDFIERVSEFDKDLLKRFVPQAYSPEIYDELESLSEFENTILTLYGYYHISDGQKIYEFIKDRSIKIVVLHMNDDWAKRVIRDIREYAKYDNNYDNLRIYIHTINNLEQTMTIINEEKFFGIYSDYLTENILEETMND